MGWARAALLLAALGAGAGAGEGEEAGRLSWAPAQYAVTSAVLLGAPHWPRAAAGYQLRGALRVRRLWPPDAHAHADDQRDLLLRFDLTDVSVWGRGAGEHAEWQRRASAAPHGPFYALLRDGLLHALRVPAADGPHERNYKRALASLFQLQLLSGARNESDVSGACSASYERDGDTLRKYKSACRWKPAGAAGAEEEEEDDEEAERPALRARRATRYTLSAARDALVALHAEEVHEAGGGWARGAALSARAWHALSAQPPPPPAAGAPHATLAQALGALPGDAREVPLPLEPADEDASADEAWRDEAVGAEALRLSAREAAALGEAAGDGGGAAAARALMRLLPALRAAGAERLRLLQQQQLPAVLEARLLGLAGSRAAHARLAGLLAPDAAAAAPLADAYYGALALAPEPEEWVVREALRVALHAATAPAVAAGALLGAAGAARARAAARAAGARALGAHVRDRLARALSDCKQDETCLVPRLLALGALRRDDCAELLLQHAERADAPRLAARAALDALDALPERTLAPPARLRRLRAVALALHAPHALDVRGAALDLLLRRGTAAALRVGALPVQLAALGADLHASGAPPELRRVFWQRARQLAERHEPARAALRALPAAWRLWARGTSQVLARRAGWRGAGLAAELHSVQLAERGLLQRGAVQLLLRDERGRAHPALQVQLWTRGLGALTGGEAEEEEAGAGLALRVGAAPLRPLQLFAGQADLLGKVWSGAGGAPTPVLRALAPARALSVRAPLCTGAELHVRARGAAALALDAHAAVSLWSRTARAALALRAGVAADCAARVSQPWAALSARAAADSEPRLRIGADVDFYDTVALCVRAHVHDHRHGRNTTLQSALGAGVRRWRVRRVREERAPHAGRTLALGRANDAACRALGAHDGDDAE